MTAKETGCCGDDKGREATCGRPPTEGAGTGRSLEGGNEVVDYKVTLLIAAGAAMAANCEMCLNKIVPDLMEAGVAEADIRRAVEIGQFVKDKPAAMMKEAADVLTGTHLAGGSVSATGGCPADKMKAAPAHA